jgi:hypothetical protein
VALLTEPLAFLDSLQRQHSGIAGEPANNLYLAHYLAVACTAFFTLHLFT